MGKLIVCALLCLMLGAAAASGQEVAPAVRDSQPVDVQAEGDLSLPADSATLTASPAAKEHKRMANEQLTVYIGTYTSKTSQGVYRSDFDPNNGTLSEPELVGETTNPSFLAIHPNGRTLYAVNEMGKFQDKPGGAVSAFTIDRQNSGRLTLLNQQPTHGGAPCYVSVDATGKVVMVANYSGGNVAIYPVNDDGSLGAPSQVIDHKPQGSDAKANAHSIRATPDNRFALAADLGLNRVLTYRLDVANAKLQPHEPPFAQLPEKTGPRHFVFSADSRFVYLINEHGGTVTVFAYDAQAGRLTEIQTISTLPEGYDGRVWCADIHLHPSGKFLYGSNRAHDSIVIYAVDQASGRLSVIGHQPSGGKTPRNFAIDPTGKYLLAAHQDSDNIVVFAIDQQTGRLTPTGQEIMVSMPVCVRFYP